LVSAQIILFLESAFSCTLRFKNWMMSSTNSKTNSRRKFITTVMSGAAAMGLSSITTPLTAATSNMVSIPDAAADAEQWFAQLQGKHKMVFDVTKHHDGAAIGWAMTLMNTYNDLGISDADLSVVLVLRSGGTPLAIGDALWAKYEFGKRIELKDPKTKKFAQKNLFVTCEDKDDECFELFQKRGGRIAVCSRAVKSMSEGIAAKYKLKKEATLKEFMDNVVPGIQLMPSGIWALNRAQELGCTFCFGG
jgi:hypothetical protein